MSNETQLQQRRNEERQAKIEALAEKLYIAAISSDPSALKPSEDNDLLMSCAIYRANEFYRVFAGKKPLSFPSPDYQRKLPEFTAEDFG